MAKRMNMLAVVGVLMTSLASAFAAVEKIDPADDHCQVYLDLFDVSESEDGRGYDVNAAAYADSVSAATITVSGLPSGLKFNASTGDILGKVTKAGLYFITVTAKNANKYQHTATVRLEIPDLVTGEVPTGEKDEIGDAGWFDLGFLDGMMTGVEMGVMAEWPSAWGLTLKGLPAGVTVVKKAWFDGSEYYDVVSGMPSKAGAFTVTATMKDPDTRKTLSTVRKIVVEDQGSFYIGAYAENGGTVSGNGVYAAGATAKLTAKASKGNAFFGWTSGGEYLQRDGSDYRNPTLSLKVCGPETLAATFGTAAQDYCAYVGPADGSDTWYVDAGYPTFPLVCDSGSLPKLTVKGLPSGVSLLKEADGISNGETFCYLLKADATKAAPGVYTVTVSAQNASKQSASSTFMIRVPNLTSDWFAVDDEYGPFEPGYEIAPIDFTEALRYDEGETLSVSGLPKGLTFNTKEKKAGPCILANSITGTPTAPGAYTVTFTAKVITDELYNERTDKYTYVYTTAKVTATFVVNDYPPVFVDFDPEAEASGCKVSGAGNYIPGSKVTLKATAGEGWVFAGWNGLPETYDGDPQAPSVTFVSEGETYVYAQFMRLRDDFLTIDLASGEFYVDASLCVDASPCFGAMYEETCFSLYSGSAATVTVSGLPSGLKCDPISGVIFGTASQFGIYTVTVSAKNAGGYAFSASFYMFVSDKDGNFPELRPLDELELDLTFLDDLQTGYCYDGDALTLYLPEDLEKVTVSGLPPGMECEELFDGERLLWFGGTLTKPGAYAVNVSAASTCTGVQRTLTTVHPIFVRDGGSRYLDVISSDPFRGSVSGSGVFAAGAEVKVTAKANKGYFFAGWYRDPDCTDPFWELQDYDDTDYRSESATFQMRPDQTTPWELYARFVSAEEDAELYFDNLDEEHWEVMTDWSRDDYPVGVFSLTKPTVTAKGLPAGIEWDDARMAFRYDAAKSKSKIQPGQYPVTLVAVNLSKATATKTVYVTIPNIRSDELPLQDEYSGFIPGVPADFNEVFADLDLTGWSIKGLPEGVKYDAKKGFSGTPTKPGSYTVWFTKGSDVATTRVVVDPFPHLELTIEAYDRDGNPLDMSEFTGKNAFTLKGAGDYPAGKSVSVSAAAPKGSGLVFAGWQGEESAMVTDLRLASGTVLMPEYGGDVYLTAVFYDESADYLYVNEYDDPIWFVAGQPAAESGNDWALRDLVESLTFPTITVSGLPSGLKFDSKSLAITGTPTAPGIYDVTMSVKNLSGRTFAQVVTVRVGDFDSSEFGSLEYSNGGDCYVGVVGEEIDDGMGGEICLYPQTWWPDGEVKTVSLSGLPAGLKCDKSTLVVSGKPTKAGNFVATVTVTFNDKKSTKAKFSALFVIEPVETLNEDCFNFDEDFWSDLHVGDTVNHYVGWQEDGWGLSGVSGLPTGLKLVKETWSETIDGKKYSSTEYSVQGTLTKPGKFTLVFSGKDGKTSVSATRKVVVRDAANWYLDIEADGEGTVTGGGLLKPGTKATVKATPTKGCVFAGWYDADWMPLDFGAGVDYRTASVSWVPSRIEDEMRTAYARFVYSSEDYISLPEEETWYLDSAYSDGMTLSLESVSLPTLKVTGLPSGVSYAVTSEGVELFYDPYSAKKLPTPGDYKVKLEATNLSKQKAICTLVVTVAPYPELTVAVEDWLYEAGNRATGGGNYPAWTTTTLKATPAKGYVFAGWESDQTGGPTFSIKGEDWRSPTLTVSTLDVDETIWARFVTTEEDQDFEVGCDYEDWIAPGSSAKDFENEHDFPVWDTSASLPTIAVSGLPPGMKFANGSISGVATEPGLYLVRIDARNVSGATAWFEFELTVGNFHSDWLPLEDVYSLMPGEPFDVWMLGYDPESFQGWTVSGLPKGMTFNSKTGEFSGTPSEQDKSYTVWFTKKIDGVTETATTVFYVESYPRVNVNVVVTDENGYELYDEPGFSVKGAGGYPANSRVTLTPVAADGYVFAGWSEVPYGVAEDFDLRNPALSFTTDGSEIDLTAYFIPAKADVLSVDDLYWGSEPDEYGYAYDADAGCLEFSVGEDVVESGRAWDILALVESQSYPEISVSGLPAGLRFDVATGLLSGAATKAGWSTVTISAVNQSGHKHTVAVRCAVADEYGDVPGETYYDELSGYFYPPSAMAVDVGFAFNMGWSPDAAVSGFTVTGQPSELKVVNEPGFDAYGNPVNFLALVGTLTKPGVYTLVFSGKVDGETLKSTMTLYVRGVASRYVAVRAITPDGEVGGTVSGGGLGDGGAEISFAATAAPGYVFAGWYCDEWCDTPFESLQSGAADYRTPTVKRTLDRTVPDVVYGLFVPVESDELDILCARDFEFADSTTLYDDDEFDLDFEYNSVLFVCADSASLPTVSLTGFPAGIKIDPDRSGWYAVHLCPTTAVKSGVYSGSITVKNKSGKSLTRRFTLNVTYELPAYY